MKNNISNVLPRNMEMHSTYGWERGPLTIF